MNRAYILSESSGVEWRRFNHYGFRGLASVYNLNAATDGKRGFAGYTFLMSEIWIEVE